MINYYFKYLELIDTVFLAIKKKPLGKSALHFSLVHVLTRRNASSVPPRVPPLRHGLAVLHPTER
jgi:hypothetical protein